MAASLLCLRSGVIWLLTSNRGVDVLHIMHVVHIRCDEFPPSLEIVVFMFCGFDCTIQFLPNDFTHLVINFPDHLVRRSSLQRHVGHGNHRIDRFVLYAAVWSPFARSVQAHQCFNELTIGEFLCFRPFGAYCLSPCKRGPDFSLAILFDPLQHGSDIALF